MWKKRIIALLILVLGAGVSYFVYSTENLADGEESKYAFQLGLDLSGGTHLVYKADVSELETGDVKDSMESLRDVIERRINLFGVSETNVQVQNPNFANQGENRIIIDLPGVTDIEQAVAMIGQTPLLEFKIENPDFDFEKAIELVGDEEDSEKIGLILSSLPEQYINTELTGRYLKRAIVDFQSGGGGSHSGGGSLGAPVVGLEFDREGADIFERLTEENLGKTIAIYLDGAPISTPVVQSVISGGEAVITGNFTPDEAKQLVGRLNSGALPVPIELLSTQTIGPTLGSEATEAGVFAGIVGFIILSVLFVLWYRLPGVVAVVALVIYGSVMFALFKLIPVTLTAAGIAGFIISLGLAVDANILIFERLKEEIKGGRTIQDAIKTGFSRAWLSIRDSNLSSILTAVILFWFGSALIKGFALTFGIGVLISMISAITVSRALLLAVGAGDGKAMKFLFGSGVNK